jgi:hypothetical protein
MSSRIPELNPVERQSVSPVMTNSRKKAAGAEGRPGGCEIACVDCRVG